MPSPTNRFDAVIFDCDGVLVDSEPIACAAHAEALSAEGLPISTEELIRRFTGRPMNEMLAELEAEHGHAISADYPARVEATVLDRFRRDLRPVAGAAETLDALRAAGTPIAVASSAAPAKLTLALTVTGLLKRLSPHVYSASQVARGKPAPDVFLLAARSLGVPPARCLVIEDSVAGAIAARAGGMACAGFVGAAHAGPDLPDRLAAEGADPVLARLGEVLALAAR